MDIFCIRHCPTITLWWQNQARTVLPLSDKLVIVVCKLYSLGSKLWQDWNVWENLAIMAIKTLLLQHLHSLFHVLTVKLFSNIMNLISIASNTYCFIFELLHDFKELLSSHGLNPNMITVKIHDLTPSSNVRMLQSTTTFVFYVL